MRNVTRFIEVKTLQVVTQRDPVTLATGDDYLEHITSRQGCQISLNQTSKIGVNFGVKLFGTGWDIMGLYEQNCVLVIDTKVLFYT